MVIKHNDANSPSGFRYELEAADVAAGRNALMLTGPIAGTMSLSDGSAYDVSEEAIAVKNEHLDELHRAIHKAHHAAGRFLDVPLPSE